MGTHAAPGEAARPLRVVVCGGGAASVLLLNALHERSRRAIDATVIEPRGQIGPGLAYSTQCESHVLNSPAGGMSATGDPDDFVKWLNAERVGPRAVWTRQDFAPRKLYGQYLRSRVERIRTCPNVRLTRIRSYADSVTRQRDQWEIVLARGEPLTADVVVLATGNEPPRAISETLSARARRMVIDDPWDVERKAEIAPDAAVLLAGTGLTAVDIAMELLDRGHRGPIHAFSRRALLPRGHGPSVEISPRVRDTLPDSVRDLVAYVHKLGAVDPSGKQWRAMIDQLRAAAPTLWHGWTGSERRRFLRHVLPFWQAHRHRVAPCVHARLSAAVAQGPLQILRGRLAEIEDVPTRDALHVTITRAGERHSLEVQHVINCTGPESDPARALNPLLQSLVGDSVARADALQLGLAVDMKSRVIAGDGSVHRTLFALGATARGGRWEVTAIPEIRQQAHAVADAILSEPALLKSDDETLTVAHEWFATLIRGGSSDQPQRLPAGRT